MNYAGTFMSYELFTHAASAICNCQNLADKPCPVGMQVEGSPEAQAFFASLMIEGYILSGYEYQETYGNPQTTVNANVSWGFGLPDDPDQTYVGCTPIADPSRIAGKWAGFDANVSPIPCAFNETIKNFKDAGALGMIIPLAEGDSLYYLFSDPFDFPIVLVTYPFYVALTSAYRTPGPVDTDKILVVNDYASCGTAITSTAPVANGRFCSSVDNTVVVQCEGGRPMTYMSCGSCSAGNLTGCQSVVAPMAVPNGTCALSNATFGSTATGARSFSCNTPATAAPSVVTSTTSVVPTPRTTIVPAPITISASTVSISFVLVAAAILAFVF
jgi:hypothetical protein